MKTIAILVLSTATLGSTSVAEATLLTYTFTSQVSRKTDPYHLIDNVNVGDAVTYVVNIDTDSPNLSSVPGVGFYTSGATMLTVGDEVSHGGPVQVEVWSAESQNPTGVFMVLLGGQLGDLQSIGTVGLVDNQRTAVPSPALPVIPYDLRLFEVASFELWVGDSAQHGVEAHVLGTILSFTITPEPSSLSMMCTTLLVVCRSSRARARGKLCCGTGTRRKSYHD